MGELARAIGPFEKASAESAAVENRKGVGSISSTPRAVIRALMGGARDVWSTFGESQS